MNIFLSRLHLFLLVIFSHGIMAISPAQESCAAAVSSHWPSIVEHARQTLPLKGTLKKKEKGYTYLKVDDEYIHALFPLLQVEGEGYSKPPYFRKKEAPGAHISVFYEDEEINPEEIGQSYSFTLSQIVTVRARDASYIILQVKSPELENLRKKYGLTPLLKNHEFHISLAKKKVKRGKS